MSYNDEEAKNDDFLNDMANMMGGAIKNIDNPKPIEQVNPNLGARNEMKERLADLRAEEQEREPKKAQPPATTMDEMSAETSILQQKKVEPEPIVEDDDEDDDEAFDYNAEPELINEEPVKEEPKEVPPPPPPEPEPKPVKEEPKAEKPKKTTKKSSNKKVSVVSPEAAEIIEESKKKKVAKVSSEIGEVDDLDAKIEMANEELLEEVRERYIRTEVADEMSAKEIKDTINDLYELDDEDTKTSVKVSITDSDTIGSIESAKKTSKEESSKKKKKTVEYNNLDSENPSFKLKVSKSSKVLRSIDVENTEELETTSIASKTAQERQNIYYKTVLPTLQPTISVVPCIVSGVVIGMTAFSWPDIKEICEYEDKIGDLDVESPDYIYEKNKLFIEKRKKQLALFYKHINSVSGYEFKPSYDEVFGKIIKFPDFPQLFFAAYTSTFPKIHKFVLTCGTCGTENETPVHPKDLCFLLNTNINLNQLNYYIEKGASSDAAVTGKVYKEFQKEKFVEMANKTYRTKKTLPDSSFLYDLKIPTVLEALDMMTDIVELFRDRDLTFTDPDSGYTVYIDSSMGLPRELVELRNYLYFNKLIVPRIVDENKEANTATVSFIDFDDKSAIINSIYNLSATDYKALMSDDILTKLIRVSGIRHAINGGKCEEPACASDLGNVPVEPETLFFTIAQQN